MSNSAAIDFAPQIKFNTDKPTYQQCLAHYKQHLRKLSYFIPADLENLENYWEFFTIKKNRPFLQPGDVCNYILFIHKGSIKHYIEDKNGKYIIDFLTDGDFCTSSKSFINQTVTDNGFICTEDTYGIKISSQKNKQLTKIHPAFEKLFNDKIEENVSKILNRLKSFQSLDAKGRYDLLLSQYPDIFARFTMQDVSNYLGIKPETLSRMRKSVRTK